MEEREYETIAQVAEAIGVARTSVYHYIAALNISTKKFKLRRERYIAAADVVRIKEAKDKPWLTGEKVGA